MNMSKKAKPTAYYAKERILAKLNAQIAEFEASTKVYDQLNRNNAYEVKDWFEQLTRVQMYKLEKQVAEAEKYDPKKDKWGFGPVTIKATDYVAFLKMS